jgi:hypothetical protein
MTHSASPDADAVSAAVSALAEFGPMNRPTAARLLSSWRRVGELSRGDVARVLAHFEPARRQRRPGVVRIEMDHERGTGAAYLDTR